MVTVECALTFATGVEGRDLAIGVLPVEVDDVDGEDAAIGDPSWETNGSLGNNTNKRRPDRGVAKG